ncbi:MAG: hypothetical protein R3202_10940, partial [Candidatus Competibacterales bacterium]|nr:hypothetical protein [Candidatus Competibacterales bacterium]
MKTMHRNLLAGVILCASSPALAQDGFLNVSASGEVTTDIAQIACTIVSGSRSLAVLAEAVTE